MIFFRIVTTVAEVFATVADTLWGTGSTGSSRRPSNDAKARCQEPAIFTGKVGRLQAVADSLFTGEETIGVFQPIDQAG